MHTRFYCLGAVLAVGFLFTGCLSSVDDADDGEGEYDYNLSIADISLEDFPVSASIVDYNITITGDGIDTADTGADYCHLLCMCLGAWDDISYEECLAEISDYSQSDCEDDYSELCL